MNGRDEKVSGIAIYSSKWIGGFKLVMKCSVYYR